MENIEKILIIKLRAIGDVVLSTIVLDNIRAAFPKARIDFLTEEASKEVVLGNPILNNVIVYDRSGVSRLSPLKRLARNIKFLQMIRHQNYDLVFDFFGNPRSAIFTLASKADSRVGYNFRFRRLAYNIKVDSRADEVHEALWHLDALTALGIPVVSRHLNFEVGEGSRNFAENFWQKEQLYDQKVIAINFSGGWPSKRWYIDRFAHLADCLIDYYQARVVIVWGPAEKEQASELQKLVTRPTVLMPDTNLKQLAAILQKVDLLVTTDSGPMHIAAAMGTPCVALFGPTDPNLQGPYGDIHEIINSNEVHCLGCNRVSCETITCMSTITVRHVLTAVKQCVEHNQLFISLA